jgi:DNA-binding response OmpR family regulator
MNEIILIVEDDSKLRSGLRDNLEFEGYSVKEAWNAELGAEVWLRDHPALVILDLMLPGKNGFSLLKRMRTAGQETPVIILSARGEEWDKVKGFRLGADDYMVKPFSVLELLVRIRAILRRMPQNFDTSTRLNLGNLELDLGNHELKIAGEIREISAREFELLAYFLRHPGRVIPRAELMEQVWHTSPQLETRSVDVHISQLRGKLKGSGCCLMTVYKAGYRLEEEDETA